jgi:hypothetical protein
MSSPNTVAQVLVKLNMFSVVKRSKNHLDILEGHFSNKETRATAGANSSRKCVKLGSGVFPLKQTNKIAFLPRIRNDGSSASIGRIVITGKERSVINIDAEAPPSESSALTKAVVEGYP